MSLPVKTGLVHNIQAFVHNTKETLFIDHISFITKKLHNVVITFFVVNT